MSGPQAAPAPVREPPRRAVSALTALALAGATACVAPASQAPAVLAGLPGGGPGAVKATPAPGAGGGPDGGELVIRPTPGGGGGTVGTGPGNLALLADLNSATPSFAVQALPDTFDRATYRVTGGSLGTPRDGRLAVEGASGRGSALLVDLPPAEYLVSISARDAGGLELASGSATVSVQAAVTATASVLLAYPGRASLGLELPQGEGPTPSFRVNRL